MLEAAGVVVAVRMMFLMGLDAYVYTDIIFWAPAGDLGTRDLIGRQPPGGQ